MDKKFIMTGARKEKKVPKNGSNSLDILSSINILFISINSGYFATANKLSEKEKMTLASCKVNKTIVMLGSKSKDKKKENYKKTKNTQVWIQDNNKKEIKNGF